MGFLAARPSRRSCCFAPFVTLFGISMAFNFALCLYLFIQTTDKVIAASSTTATTRSTSTTRTIIQIFHWLNLALFSSQCILLCTFFILHSCCLCGCCRPRQTKAVDNQGPFQRYHDDLEGGYAAHIADSNAKLAKLRAEVAVSSTMKKNNGAALLSPTTIAEMACNHHQKSNAAGEDYIKPYHPQKPTSHANQHSTQHFQATWAAKSNPNTCHTK